MQPFELPVSSTAFAMNPFAHSPPIQQQIHGGNTHQHQWWTHLLLAQIFARESWIFIYVCLLAGLFSGVCICCEDACETTSRRLPHFNWLKPQKITSFCYEYARFNAVKMARAAQGDYVVSARVSGAASTWYIYVDFHTIHFHEYICAS